MFCDERGDGGLTSGGKRRWLPLRPFPTRDLTFRLRRRPMTAAHLGMLMKQMNALGFVLSILVTLVGGSAARASSLPVGTGFVSCNTSPGITDPVSCTGATNSGLVTYSPFAGVSGSALGEGLVDQAGVFGVLNYSFEVTGGAVGDVVPVDLNTTLTAVPISGGSVFSEIIVTADTDAGVTICNTGCIDEATGFSGTLQVNALSGTIYTNAIHLEIEVIGALGGTSDVDGGTASADPFLFIDPTLSDAGAYSIEVSPNIGNVSEAVPESATWAMLLVGFAALAGLRYHRVDRRRSQRQQSPLGIA
jgi:hypothetical protein